MNKIRKYNMDCSKEVDYDIWKSYQDPRPYSDISEDDLLRMKMIISCLKKLSGKTMSSGYGYQLKKHFQE
jgi:hypothetical protein